MGGNSQGGNPARGGNLRGGILRVGKFSGGEFFAKWGGILRAGTCTGGNPPPTDQDLSLNERDYKLHEITGSEIIQKAARRRITSSLLICDFLFMEPTIIMCIR